MHGMSTYAILAEIGIPSAWQCFVFAAPILSVIVVWNVINHADEVIERLFPHWEWEKGLGWLNLRAEKQADAFFRWLGYFTSAWLAMALVGILWGAKGMPLLAHWDDPNYTAELGHRASVLLVCLGLWMIYLGIHLIPNLRKQYEMEELEKFRAEQEEIDRERHAAKAARAAKGHLHSDLVMKSGRSRPGG